MVGGIATADQDILVADYIELVEELLVCCWSIVEILDPNFVRGLVGIISEVVRNSLLVFPNSVAWHHIVWHLVRV